MIWPLLERVVDNIFPQSDVQNYNQHISVWSLWPEFNAIIILRWNEKDLLKN